MEDLMQSVTFRELVETRLQERIRSVKQEDILTILSERMKRIPPEVEKNVLNITSITDLNRLLILAVRINSMAEFAKELG